MKKYLAAISATALISVAPFAMAASSTDLTVTGSITPSACDVSLSNNGLIEIGAIPVSDLNPTSYTLVGTNDLQLTVTCDAANEFALKMIDNRAGTGSATGQYGLGLTQANEPLGVFNIELVSITADTVAARAIQSFDNAGSWGITYYARPNSLVSTANSTDLLPIPVKDLSMDLRVRTNIARADGLTLTDEVPIDGSATLEVQYL